MRYSRRLKPFSLIAAIDSKNGVGRDQTLPWKLRQDMAFFRAVTTNGIGGVTCFVPPLDPLKNPSANLVHDENAQNVVIMGRKTWCSLPPKHRPLLARQNIILSRTSSDFSKVPVSASFEMALGLPETMAAPEVFVIGGAAVFAEAIVHPLCNRVILTRIDGDFGCDVFFPPMPNRFHCVTTSEWKTENTPSAEGPTSTRFRFEIWETSV